MDLDALERNVRRLAVFLPLLQALQEQQDAGTSVGQVTVQLSAETSPEFKALLDHGTDLFGKVETALADLDIAKATYTEASEKLDAFLAAQAAKPVAEPEPSGASVAPEPAPVAPAA